MRLMRFSHERVITKSEERNGSMLHNSSKEW